MKIEEFNKEAIEIVKKVAKDTHTEAKIRLQALVFVRKYDEYLKELSENDEL